MTNESWFQLDSTQSPFLAKNLKLFEQRHPHQVKSIKAASLDPYYFSHTENQFYACRLHQETQDFFMHDSHTLPATLRRFEQIANQAVQSGSSLFAIVGHGLGYLARHMEKAIRGDLSKGLILIENRPELALAQFALFDCTDLLHSHQIYWAIAPSVFSILETLFTQEGIFQIDEKQVVMVPGRSLSNEERVLYQQFPQWYASARQTYIRNYQHKRKAFDQRMTVPANLSNGRIWSQAAAAAYAHAPLVRSLLEGFEQHGWQKQFMQLEDSYTTRFRILDAIIEFAPDLFLICNTASDAFISRSINRPRICWFLDNPRHFNDQSFPDRLHQLDHVFYADRAYAPGFENTAAGSHQFLPVSSSLARTGVYRRELAAPILFVGSYDPADVHLQTLSSKAREETYGWLDAMIRRPDSTALQLAQNQAISTTTLHEIDHAANQFAVPLHREFSSDEQRMEYFLYALANSRKREQYVRALLPHGIVVYGPDRWLSVLGERHASQFRGWLSFEDLADAYASADICLNIHSLQCPTCFNSRDFDILYVQGCLLSEWVDDMSHGLLLPEHDFVCFHTVDELIRKTEKLLANEDLRQEIRKQGHINYLNRHTPAHRAHDILEVLRNHIP